MTHFLCCYRRSVNEVGPPPTMVGGVHLQVRLRLLKNLKRKYGVYPPHHGGGVQLHLLTSGKKNTRFQIVAFQLCNIYEHNDPDCHLNQSANWWKVPPKFYYGLKPRNWTKSTRWRVSKAVYSKISVSGWNRFLDRDFQCLPGPEACCSPTHTTNLSPLWKFLAQKVTYKTCWVSLRRLLKITSRFWK